MIHNVRIKQYSKSIIFDTMKHGRNWYQHDQSDHYSSSCCLHVLSLQCGNFAFYVLINSEINSVLSVCMLLETFFMLKRCDTYGKSLNDVSVNIATFLPNSYAIHNRLYLYQEKYMMLFYDKSVVHHLRTKDILKHQ